MTGQYFVYMMASLSHVLYVGVTKDLARRVAEHKSGQLGGFTHRYRCHSLVWFDATPDVGAAIAHEKRIKGWSRSKKVALIEAANPHWRDLSTDWT